MTLDPSKWVVVDFLATILKIPRYFVCATRKKIKKIKTVEACCGF
jgi:hypothetical protein